MIRKKTPKKPKTRTSEFYNLMWWTTLLVAVLAVPCVGVIVVLAIGAHGFMQIAIFICVCWICTFLGMKLMNHRGMNKKIHISKE